MTFTDEKQQKKDMLVLQNLMEKEIRLLDLKVGSVTAVANWQGKSWFGSVLQKFVDFLSNSQQEGFRLEGFTGKKELPLQE